MSCLLLTLGLGVGLPSLNSGFLSGDDENLIFNHALVNHPSLHHALKLFEIVHRDLYQPLPLLTFQIEFALHGASLPLMHLANVLIHVANGLLVWVLFRRLLTDTRVPLVMAGLFIIHPLGVECHAWLNGRMMMLSTLFSLAALIAFDHLLCRPRSSSAGGRQTARLAGWLVLVMLFTALAMMSKLRVGLPVLLLLVAAWRCGVVGYRLLVWAGIVAGYLVMPLLAVLTPELLVAVAAVAAAALAATVWRRRRQLDVVLWSSWAAVAALAVLFFVVNLDATHESMMFEGAERQLHGPNGARVLLAVAWYFTHYVWPAGLAPYYAPPRTVAWTDPQVLQALAVTTVVVLAVVISRRWSRVGPAGLIWFAATVMSTLPFIPTRNLLVADRYVYLPNIGLHWIAASAACWAYSRLTRGAGASLRRTLLWAGAAGVVVAATLTSRQVAGYYHDDISKVKRILAVSPQHPTILTAWGWYAYQRGDYATALEKANQELQANWDDDVAFARAMNLRAMSRYSLNRDVVGAEQDLQAAIERAPQFAKSYFRRGLIYEEQGRDAEAVEQLQRAVELAPAFNPALKLLGRIYRRQGRFEQAIEVLQQALDHSKGYDVEAINALGEIDIEQGRYDAAIARYQALLSWHGTDIPARLNLALALRTSNRPQDAGRQYAALLALYPNDRRVLIRTAEFLRLSERYATAVTIWRQALNSEPAAVDLWAWLSLHQWYAGDVAGARQSALRSAGQPIADLTLLLAAVSEQDAPTVAERAERLAPDRALLGLAYEALEFCSRLDQQSPWPYYVTVALLVAEGRTQLARQARQDFVRLCPEEQWHRRLDALLQSAGDPAVP